MKNILHVVLISFKPEASKLVRQEIYDRYQTLAQDCGGENAGILFWKVDHNLNLRKNVHLVEIAVFKDTGALRAFGQHPKHKEFTDMLSKVADWQVGDIHHPFVKGGAK